MWEKCDRSWLPNETNKTHCQITEQKTDEISHPIPTFNSTESLIGTSVPESGNSPLGEQNTFQTIETNQPQVALAWDAVENQRVELIPHLSSFIVQSNNKNIKCTAIIKRELQLSFHYNLLAHHCCKAKCGYT